VVPELLAEEVAGFSARDGGRIGMAFQGFSGPIK